MQDLSDDDWLRRVARYRVGSLHEGTVARISSEGLVVELEPQITGLLSVAELAKPRPDDPKEMVIEKGQTLQLEVLNIDLVKRSISLGLGF